MARDTHARFEHAQSRTQRCERALKTVYHDMPRFDKLEALTQKLVVKESREIDRQLVQLVDSRCKQLQETFLMKNNGAREFGSRSEEEGSLRLRGSGRLNGSLENEKSGEGVFKRKEGGLGSGERGLREASKDRRVDRKAKSFPGMAELASEGQLEDQLAEVAVDELQEQVDCQTEWCEQTHRRGKNECCGHHGCQQNGRKELEAREFEERIRETVEAALAGRLAASVPAETATREVESGRAASEEPSVREANSKGRERDVQGTETVSGGRNEGAAANRDGGTVERAKVPEEGAEDTRFDELVGAVAALRRDVAEVQR